MIFNTTDEVSLGNTDMIVEISFSRHGVATDLFNLFIDLLANILLNLLKLISRSPVLIKEHATCDFNRVTGFANISDLFFASVCDARVGH